MPADPLHLPALLRLMPKGAHDLSAGTLVVEDLSTVALALDTVDEQLTLLLAESMPQEAEALLSRWEALLGLRNRGLSVLTRRARIVARLRLVPDMCPATIEARAEDYTRVDIDLLEVGAFLCNDPDSLCDEPDDVVDGAFVFILAGDSAEAHTTSMRRSDLLTLVEDIKPAHTVGIVRFDDFFTNDPLSITDCDLLGV